MFAYTAFMSAHLMTETIDTLLTDIERQHGVTILYACETGSRAWGFPSPDSDYDVRMIYRHDLDWYLSLSDKKDTIDFMSADNELDVTGWDIKKCLQLMWRSNGALLERVQSPIVYRNENDIVNQLKDLAFQCYSPIATMHHYLGMARNTFAEIGQSETVKLKKLFYALRAALACKWILDENTPPPIVFTEMVNVLGFDAHLKERIFDLIGLKSGKPESYIHPAEKGLNELVWKQISRAEEAFNGLPGRRAQNVSLDTFFAQVVKGTLHDNS